jgi:hypothetical protein
MGREAICTVLSDGQKAQGKARLESSTVEFTGPFRLQIRFADITSVDAQGGELRIRYRGKRARFALGAEAAKWADRIRSPRSVLDKLGVKPGQCVVVLAMTDGNLRQQLESRDAVVTTRFPRQPADVVFLGAAAPRDLRRLATIRRAIAPAGAVWVLWPKGRRELKEDDVRAAAIANDLVDVKVVAFSDTHSALKLVIPRASR